jgi:ABC-type nitrate/sulfonate/bicarbonate transport system substrate-binding protein
LTDALRVVAAVVSADGRRGLRALALVIALCVLPACRSDIPNPTGAPLIRVGYAGSLDFSDMAAEVAHQQLTRSGYLVAMRAFPTVEIAADALARGDVDIAFGATRPFWSAIARGAPVRSVMEHVANIHRLVASNAATKVSVCDAFNRQPLALQSEGAAGTAFARAWLARACPGARYDLIFMPGSQNRMAGLRSGAMPATVLQMSDVTRLESMAPTRFTVIADFAAEWPRIRPTLVHVNTTFAATHPDSVRAYLRARLVANRLVVADEATLLTMAGLRLGTTTNWSALSGAYRTLPVWDTRGGLTPTHIADTLAFLQQHTGLAPALTAAQVADTTTLDAVLHDLDTDAAASVPAAEPSDGQ